MSDDRANVSRRHDLVVLFACGALLAIAGMATVSKVVPAEMRVEAAGPGRMLVRHAIVGGLLLLGPLGAELILAN